MAEGLNIDANLGVKGFLRGTKDMTGALEDVSDELKSTGKDGEISVEKITNSLDDLAKQAKTTGNSVEKNLSQGTKKGAQEAEDATAVYKKEAIANISEVTSSFNGSWESAADAVQGTLGGVVADLGPVGAALGAAGALGVGLLTAELVNAEERAKQAKERVKELSLAIIESGRESAELDAVVENLKLIVTNADEAPRKFQDIQKEAKQTGLDVDKLATAYAGNADALDEVIKAAQDAYEEEQKLVVINGESQKVISEKEIALQQVAQALIEVQKGNELAGEAEQGYLGAGAAEFAAKRESIAQIDAAYDDAVYGIDNFLNAETGIYDLDAFAQSIRDREKLLLDYQTLLAESELTTDQKTALNEYGVEQAAAILKGLKDPNVSQQTKETIKKGLGEASKEGSGVAQEELKKAFKDPIEAKIEAVAEVAAAEKALEKVIKDRTARIIVKTVDTFGRDVN
jgi:polyhydroxyalkanoate synthesis regulator phasin